MLEPKLNNAEIDALNKLAELVSPGHSSNPFATKTALHHGGLPLK